VGLFLTGLVISCGGGGGDDGDDDDIRILDEYNYSLTTPPGTIYANFTQSEGTTAYAFTVGVEILGGGLSGTYNRITEELTVSDGVLSIDSDIGEALFGTLTIGVAETISFPSDGFPTSGELEVSSTGIGADLITISYNPDAGGIGVPGVDLYYDDDLGNPKNLILGPESYSWEDFEALLDSEDPDVETWERKASFSFGILTFLFEQTGYVLEAFDLIDENVDTLLDENPVLEVCDPFAPAYTAPGGVIDPGTMEFGWEDLSSDGDVSGGDKFTMAFTDCWVNDQEDDMDDLLNGEIEFTEYWEGIEEIEGVETLTMIGFPLIVFNDFAISETEEDPPGVCSIDPESVTTLTGSFGLLFFAD